MTFCLPFAYVKEARDAKEAAAKRAADGGGDLETPLLVRVRARWAARVCCVVLCCVKSLAVAV